ncbi:protein translocase subunit SecF [Roseateles chitinivorans]|uniref:protein translocase subunit SecF n=1 Tax=Roseateles chitinivorans TaxID=2917965 RepID=UPI003D675B21
MEFFRIKRDIPFMKHALILNAVSFLTFVAAVFFLVTKGLHFSIEFTGGTVVEVQYAQAADINKTRHTVEQMGFGEIQVTNFGTSRDVMIRLPVKPDVKQDVLVSRVFGELCKSENGQVVQHQEVTPQGEAVTRQACAVGDAEPLKLTRSEVVGPSVGAELAHDAAYALGFTVIGIMLYLAFRFEWKFAVAGIIANLHDVVIILGFFAYFQWEFSLAVLAAILAVLGYSVNESVVIFDRIREAFRKYRKLNTHEVIDHAITSTISRTIITHGSTQMMVLSMLLFGGPTLHYFAVALTIGILFGIYSSVFVAAAIAMWLGVKREDLVKAGPAKAGDPDDPNAGAVV